jgi:glycosyltransferase involved in cell wall biosynthesis
MERLKCLLVHDYEVGKGGGGVSILNYDLAEFLNNKNWKVTLFSPLSGLYKEKTCFDLGWKFKDLKNFVSGSDIVLINLSISLRAGCLRAINLCRKYNKPFIIWFHIVLDGNVYKGVYGEGGFKKRIRILKEILNDNLCQKIVCVSKAVKNYLNDLVEKEKLITLYPGVKIFEKEEAEIFGDLLYVGRFSEEKNVQALIKALRKLRSDFPEIKLNLVGSGPEEEELKKMVKRFKLEKNVQFLDYLKREEIFSLYKTHKILVLPSKIESLGLVIVEALSQNLIPITRKTYGPKEILNNERFFFDGDENGLYEKIKDVLRNYENYKKIVLGIRKEILSKFDYKRNFNLMEMIILESILFKKEKVPVFKAESSPIFV